MSFWALNAAAAWKASSVKIISTSDGLHAAGDQHVQGEVVRRRVLGQHQLLAAQVGHGLDVLADHDAVAAVGEVDLLIDRAA